MRHTSLILWYAFLLLTQRLELFHKYAVSSMCKAGIPVLDVYPMTASYPNGTIDHVHYSGNVQRAAEDQLITFVMEEMKKKRATEE